MFSEGEKVKVAIAGNGNIVWHPAIITSITCPGTGEDQPRYNVELLTDGRAIYGVHCLMIKKIEEVSHA